MDRSFIFKRNNRQICHPAELCVCALNVRMKIPPHFEEDRALISQRTPLHPSFPAWLGQSSRLNKHAVFTQQQVKRLSITSLRLRLAAPRCPSAGEASSPRLAPAVRSFPSGTRRPAGLRCVCLCVCGTECEGL